MHLFTYGTLMDSEIMNRVSGASHRSRKASLSHYVRKRVRGEAYPAIIRNPADSVDGVIYYHVSSEAFDRLDRYEGSLYTRRQVIVVCGNGYRVAAQTYVVKPRAAHLLSEEDWSYEHFLRHDKPFFQE